MNKYTNRIQSEFENILLELSKNINTSYEDAINEAKKYCEDFTKKKNLTDKDCDDIYDLCLELVGEWFPDTSTLNYANF